MTLAFHVLDSDGTYLGPLPSANKKSILIEMNGSGSGKFIINAMATDANLLICERIIEARWEGSAIFHFIVQKMRRPIVVQSKDQAIIEVSGQGILSLLRKLVLYPPLWPAVVMADANEMPLVCAPSFGIGWYGLLNSNVDLPFTFGFGPTKDCNLVNWPLTVNLEFRPGQTMWDVMQALTARGYGVIYDPTTRTVNAYVTPGNNLSAIIIFQEGLNILEYIQELDTLDLATVVLGAGQQAIVETTDFGWTTRRRQAFLQVQNAADEQQIAEANTVLLGQISAPIAAYTLVVRNSPRASYDYHVGDTISVRTSALGSQEFQVLTIGIEDADADYRVSLGLNIATIPPEVRQRVASDALAFDQSPGNRARLNARDVRTTRPIVTFDWFLPGMNVTGDQQGGVYRVENRLQIIGASGGCSVAIMSGDWAEIMMDYSLDEMSTWTDLFAAPLRINGDTATLTTAQPTLRVLQPGTYLRLNVDRTAHDSLNDLSVRLRTREI